jgi:hypothetical protein
MLERATGGPSGRRHFDAGGESGRIRVRSGALAEAPAVVFATERMDEDPGWRNLEPEPTIRPTDSAVRATRREAFMLAEMRQTSEVTRAKATAASAATNAR